MFFGSWRRISYSKGLLVAKESLLNSSIQKTLRLDSCLTTKNADMGSLSAYASGLSVLVTMCACLETHQ